MTEEPVQGVPGEGGEPAPGIALCLSGGGYRAMLFHLGALWRLNEAGYLPRLERVSSVSGGSMTNGALAHAWGRLDFDDAGVARNFGPALVDPVRRLAGKTIDIWAIVLGILLPGSIGNWYARSLKRNLLGRRDPAGPARPAALRLQRDQPPIGRPLALLEAVHARLPGRRDKDADDRARNRGRGVRRVSAAPLPGHAQAEADGLDARERPRTAARRRSPRRSCSPTAGSTTTSGSRPRGSATKTILISDGGGHVGGNRRPEGRLDPPDDSAFVGVIDSQVRALRKRQAIGGFQAGDRKGTYWGIRTDIARLRARRRAAVPGRPDARAGSRRRRG